MSAQAKDSSGCPVHSGRDDRKTGEEYKVKLPTFPNSRPTRNFRLAREVLRSPEMRQAASSADSMDFSKPDEISFFFLHGDEHKKRRTSVAAYFAPKAIVSRYNPLMQNTMDRLIADFQKSGTALVDDMSLQLAADVTMEIVGLTETDRKDLTWQIKRIMGSQNSFDKRPLYRFLHDVAFGWLFNGLYAWRIMKLYRDHIVPAAEARRTKPGNDVMTYMVENNYSKKGMIIEVMTYAGAGVSTTREFMVLAAWQLCDHPELKERFLAGDEGDQFAIIEEILRIDPIAGFLYRKPVNDVPGTVEGTIKAGELLALDIRGANADETVVGECPFQIDPDRAKRQKVAGSWMSFGDGPHRCPGSQVALHETRIFLDRLLRVPGFKLVGPPKLYWSLSTQGYELREAVATCDKV